MQLSCMSEKLYEIESLNMNSKSSINKSRDAYKELIKLKEKVININLKELSSQQLEELELLKFKLLEEIIFTKMDLRDLMGLPSNNLFEKLDLLYSGNTGNYYE